MDAVHSSGNECKLHWLCRKWPPLCREVIRSQLGLEEPLWPQHNIRMEGSKVENLTTMKNGLPGPQTYLGPPPQGGKSLAVKAGIITGTKGETLPPAALYLFGNLYDKGFL